MRKLFERLRGKKRVIPFNEEYLRALGLSMTQYLANPERLKSENLSAAAYDDFTRGVFIMGYDAFGMGSGSKEAETMINHAISEYAGNDEMLGKQLRCVAGQAHYAALASYTTFSIGFDNSFEGNAWLGKDAYVRYSSNKKGERYLYCLVENYSFMSGNNFYCLTQDGNLIEVEDKQATDHKLASRKTIEHPKNSGNMVQIVPIVTTRSTIQIKIDKVSGSVRYDYVDAEININHPRFTIKDTKHNANSLEINHENQSEEQVNSILANVGENAVDFKREVITNSYFEAREKDTINIEKDMSTRVHGRVIPFTPDYLQQMSERVTEYHNSEEAAIKDDSCYGEFTRGTFIVSYNTLGMDAKSEKTKQHIDKIISDYADGDALLETHLRRAGGQSHMAALSFFLQWSVDRASSGFPFANWDEEYVRIHYATDEAGDKYQLLLIEKYVYSDGEYSYCLTEDGELIQVDPNDSKNLGDDVKQIEYPAGSGKMVTIKPIVAARARVKMTSDNENNQVRYDYVDAEININHPKFMVKRAAIADEYDLNDDIKLARRGQDALDFEHMSFTKEFFIPRERHQSNLENDMPPHLKASNGKKKSAFFQPVDQEKQNNVPTFKAKSANARKHDDKVKRRKRETPKGIDFKEHQKLNHYQQDVVRHIHQNTDIQYHKKKNANTMTFRERQYYSEPGDHYDINFSGNVEQWKVDGKHLASSANMAKAMFDYDEKMIITLESRASSLDDKTAFLNDVEAMIRLVVQNIPFTYQTPAHLQGSKKFKVKIDESTLSSFIKRFEGQRDEMAFINHNLSTDTGKSPSERFKELVSKLKEIRDDLEQAVSERNDTWHY